MPSASESAQKSAPCGRMRWVARVEASKMSCRPKVSVGAWNSAIWVMTGEAVVPPVLTPTCSLRNSLSFRPWRKWRRERSRLTHTAQTADSTSRLRAAAELIGDVFIEEAAGLAGIRGCAKSGGFASRLLFRSGCPLGSIWVWCAFGVHMLSASVWVWCGLDVGLAWVWCRFAMSALRLKGRLSGYPAFLFFLGG